MPKANPSSPNAKRHNGNPILPAFGKVTVARYVRNGNFANFRITIDIKPKQPSATAALIAISAIFDDKSGIPSIVEKIRQGTPMLPTSLVIIFVS